MGMGFAPTWLRQVSPPPASQNHFNHWNTAIDIIPQYLIVQQALSWMAISKF